MSTKESFLDLHGIIKTRRKIDFKKLRKDFIKEFNKSFSSNVKKIKRIEPKNLV